MKFKVKIEEEDYIRYNIYIAFHSRAGRGALFRGRIFGLAISLFALLVMYVVKADRGLIMTEAAFLAVFSAIWFFSYPYFAKKSIRKRANGRPKSRKAERSNWNSSGSRSPFSRR